MVELNLIRISFASIIFVMFQIYNILFHIDILWQSISCLVTSVIEIVYFVYSILKSRKPIRKVKCSRIFLMSFWIVMLIGMIPYIIRDFNYAMNPGYIRPINLTLFAIAIITVPVFTIRQISTVFSMFYIVNTAIALIKDAPPGFHLGNALISVIGFIIAVIFQYQNLFTICKLQSEIRIDGLTGILNRRAGMEKLETTLELCKRSLEPVAVFLADIDFFKKYNDTFGHQSGDMALKLVSKAIKTVFARATDTVCRYGGEEFLICVSCTEDEAINSANKLLAAITGLKMKAPENPISDYLTVSVGCTVYMPAKDRFNVDASALIEKADAAMYMAKNSGRNKIYLLPFDERV